MAAYPQFFFTVESIYVPYPIFCDGQWQPPKDPRRHVRDGRTLQKFFYDGFNTAALDDLQDISHLAEHSTYTTYYGTHMIWIAPQDASDPNGESLSGSDDSENEGHGDDSICYIAWRNLSFRHFFDGHRNPITYAGYRLEQEKIANQHPAQLWPHHLLPQCYHTLPNVRAFGQLIGELAVLIGLIATSLDAASLRRMLPPAMSFQRDAMGNATRWNVDLQNMGWARSGWFEGRGLVVRVLYDQRTTTQADLEAYERGYHGPLLA